MVGGQSGSGTGQATLRHNESCVVCRTKHFSDLSWRNHVKTVAHLQRVRVYEFLSAACYFEPSERPAASAQCVADCDRKLIGLDQVQEYHDTSGYRFWACTLCYTAGVELAAMATHVASNVHRAAYINAKHSDKKPKARSARALTEELNALVEQLLADGGPGAPEVVDIAADADSLLVELGLTAAPSVDSVNGTGFTGPLVEQGAVAQPTVAPSSASMHSASAGQSPEPLVIADTDHGTDVSEPVARQGDESSQTADAQSAQLETVQAQTGDNQGTRCNSTSEPVETDAARSGEQDVPDKCDGAAHESSTVSLQSSCQQMSVVVEELRAERHAAVGAAATDSSASGAAVAPTVHDTAPAADQMRAERPAAADPTPAVADHTAATAGQDDGQPAPGTPTVQTCDSANGDAPAAVSVAQTAATVQEGNACEAVGIIGTLSLRGWNSPAISDSGSKRLNTQAVDASDETRPADGTAGVRESSSEMSRLKDVQQKFQKLVENAPAPVAVGKEQQVDSAAPPGVATIAPAVEDKPNARSELSAVAGVQFMMEADEGVAMFWCEACWLVLTIDTNVFKPTDVWNAHCKTAEHTRAVNFRKEYVIVPEEIVHVSAQLDVADDTSVTLAWRCERRGGATVYTLRRVVGLSHVVEWHGLQSHALVLCMLCAAKWPVTERAAIEAHLRSEEHVLHYMHKCQRSKLSEWNVALSHKKRAKHDGLDAVRRERIIDTLKETAHRRPKELRGTITVVDGALANYSRRITKEALHQVQLTGQPCIVDNNIRINIMANFLRCKDEPIPLGAQGPVQLLLDACKEPVVGVDGVYEVRSSCTSIPDWRSYFCSYCPDWVPENALLDHLLQIEHRVAVLVRDHKMLAHNLPAYVSPSSRERYVASCVQQVAAQRAAGRNLLRRRLKYRVDPIDLMRSWPYANNDRIEPQTTHDTAQPQLDAHTAASMWQSGAGMDNPPIPGVPAAVSPAAERHSPVAQPTAAALKQPTPPGFESKKDHGWIAKAAEFLHKLGSDTKRSRSRSRSAGRRRAAERRHRRRSRSRSPVVYSRPVYSNASRLVHSRFTTPGCIQGF